MRPASVRLCAAAAFVAAMGCRPSPVASNPEAQVIGDPPAILVGTFDDDYGSRHAVSKALWLHDASTRYEIVQWVPQHRYLVARNHPDNPGDGGKWTRIDWMELSGMEPFGWAFCMSAYAAPSREAAAATEIADRSQPKSGCNGFPFTRMARAPGS